jgi:predicted transcriptional regulator
MAIFRGVFLLAFAVAADGFFTALSPSHPKFITSKDTVHLARYSTKLRTRFGKLARMAMDEDELDRKLRELAAERGRSLDEVMGDSVKSKQRIQDAQSARIEEASAERARLSGSAEAAARGRNTDNIVESPSFLKQALNNADQQEREVAAATPQVRLKSSMEGVDIDPRGFIVPKVCPAPHRS